MTPSILITTMAKATPERFRFTQSPAMLTRLRGLYGANDGMESIQSPISFHVAVSTKRLYIRGMIIARIVVSVVAIDRGLATLITIAKRVELPGSKVFRLLGSSIALPGIMTLSGCRNALALVTTIGARSSNTAQIAIAIYTEAITKGFIDRFTIRTNIHSGTLTLLKPYVKCGRCHENKLKEYKG